MVFTIYVIFSGDAGKKGDHGEKGKILIVSEEESFEAKHTIESSYIRIS